MAPAIRFRSAVALLGAFPALAGVDLDVARGEVVLLQGANGAGKTSVLRACAGLLPVISGEAEVLGHDLLQDRRAVRRQLALLGHATSLYDDLTVADNVRFAVRAFGGRVGAVDGALDRLGLTGRLRTTTVGRLSGGPRRPTALTPGWTPSTAISSTAWCVTLSLGARPWSSRRTSTSGRAPWPAAS
jgi:ABC-type multidrug transport system ATPase subunit